MEMLRIKCITWNIQTGWPEEDLGPLLGLTSSTTQTARTTSNVAAGAKKNSNQLVLPHIYIVSLQEVRSQPQNIVMDMVFEEPWTKTLMDALAPYDYVKVAGERLQGCVTSVFVMRELVPDLRDVTTAVTRTGLGGFWGNKGSVSVRFSVHGCSVCVVNCHLAAHDGGFNDRIHHYNTIVAHTEFPRLPPTTTILYHDYVFWMGDLNFRLTEGLNASEIAARAAAGDFAGLYDQDELHRAQVDGDAFENLIEAPLAFPPTYKYKERSQDDYDLNRRPAWTDRILHAVHRDAYENVTLTVQQSSYTAHPHYTQSDHKPVSADYSIKVFSKHRERSVGVRATGAWVVGDGGAVVLTLDADVTLSSLDYIALFKEDFSSLEQYVSYRYLPEDTMAGPATIHVSLRDELIQDCGRYRLLFISRQYACCLGMSDPFPVLAALPAQ